MMGNEMMCDDSEQRLSVNGSDIEQPIQCPSCDDSVRVPPVPPALPFTQVSCAVIFCPKCGQQNSENNYKCASCQFPLHDSGRPQYVVTEDSTLGGLVPYKNAQALWAYYLGVFSLIPCVGIPLGIAALILGIRGLKYAELHPEAKGKGHAWTGIVLGGLCVVVYTLLLVISMMGA